MSGKCMRFFTLGLEVKFAELGESQILIEAANLRLEEHLRTCEPCREDLERFKEMADGLGRIVDARAKGPRSMEEQLEMARRVAEHDDQEGLGEIEVIRHPKS